MKKNEIIRCLNQEDVQTTIAALEAAGFQAIPGGHHGLVVTITEVPETEYLLQVWSETDTQTARCSTREDAEAEAEEFLRDGYELAEIAEGYPGEWMPVWRKQGRRRAWKEY